MGIIWDVCMAQGSSLEFGNWGWDSIFRKELLGLRNAWLG